MAYQLFAEGKDTGWGHIHYKIEFETTRDKTKLGIRWKITSTIDKSYFFGFNLNAQVWTEGQDHGGIIKNNFPNRESVTKYFPNETEYLWFDEGYASNEINGCRIIINSTNGGSAPFDTAPSPENPDRILKTDIGYTFSTLTNNLDFNIGNNIPIIINDVTNLNYSYKLYLDVYNESNQWQNVKLYETSSKNFTLDISDITNTLYNLLPTRNDAPVRLRLETRINNTLLGTVVREGKCHVVDSNPDLPIFNLLYDGDWLNENQLTFVRRGYSPYNPIYNTWLRIRMPQDLTAKNGATLKKYIFNGGTYTQDIDIRTIIPQSGGGGGGDINSQYELVYVETEEKGEDVYNSFYSLTVVDSRGNSSTRKFDCQVDYFIEPYFTKAELKRVDGIEKTVIFHGEGKYLHGYDVNTKPIISYYSKRADQADTTDGLHNILDSQITMTGDGNFTVDVTLEYKDIGLGFDPDYNWNIYFNLYIPPMSSYFPKKQEFYLSKGIPLVYYSKNGVAYGAPYDEELGGALQINGKRIDANDGGSETLVARYIVPNNTSYEFRLNNLGLIENEVYEIAFIGSVIGPAAATVSPMITIDDGVTRTYRAMLDGILSGNDGKAYTDTAAGLRLARGIAGNRMIYRANLMISNGIVMMTSQGGGSGASMADSAIFNMTSLATNVTSINSIRVHIANDTTLFFNEKTIINIYRKSKTITATVINALTSDNITDALSAAMGKFLNDAKADKANMAKYIIHRRPIFGIAGDTVKNNDKNTWVDLTGSDVYNPRAYGSAQIPVPAGYTRYVRGYAIYSDNVNQGLYGLLIKTMNSSLDRNYFRFDKSWGDPSARRDAYSSEYIPITSLFDGHVRFYSVIPGEAQAGAVGKLYYFELVYYDVPNGVTPV